MTAPARTDALFDLPPVRGEAHGEQEDQAPGIPVAGAWSTPWTHVVTVDVYGLPIAKGNMVAFNRPGGGRPIVTDRSGSTGRTWQAAITTALLDALPDRQPPPTGDRTPWKARAVFTMPKPAAAPKRRRVWPCSKPDLDKLLRCLDAVNAAAICWSDDARCVEVTGVKTYPGEHPDALDRPGLRLTLWTVTP